MAYQANPQPAAPAFYMGTKFQSQLIHIWSSSLLMVWKSSKGWPRDLGLSSQVADPKDASGFWLQIGSAVGVAAIHSKN